MLKHAMAAIGLMILAGCADVLPEGELADAIPIGQFRLGHNIAIADSAVRGAYADDFTSDGLEASLQNAVARRLRSLDGDGLYHLGMVVGGVTMAQPGVPTVYAQDAAMVVDVTVYDNDTGKALNTEPYRIVAKSRATPATPIIGGSAIGAPDVQLEALSREVADSIERWLRSNSDWFLARDDQVRLPFDLSVPVPTIDTSSVADIAEAARVTN